MNIITWIYVFALYILCSRGVYFKTHQYNVENAANSKVLKKTDIIKSAESYLK